MGKTGSGMRLWLCFVGASLFWGPAFAQLPPALFSQPAPPDRFNQPPPPPSAERGGEPSIGAGASGETVSWWSVNDAMTISAVVLLFGLITLGIAAYLIREERDSQVVLRVLATVLIITFAVFLIVAGYSDQQIAPAMGLLGTIAGYLLGKDRPPRETKSEERPPG